MTTSSKKKEVYNVVIWFKNGESRTFGVTDHFYDGTGMAFEHALQGGTINFSFDSIAGHYNPKYDWRL